MSLSSRFFKNSSKKDNGLERDMNYTNEGETNEQIESSGQFDNTFRMKSDFFSRIHDSEQLDKGIIVIDESSLDDERRKANSEEREGIIDKSRSNLFSKFAYESSTKLTITLSKKRFVFSDRENLTPKKQKSTPFAKVSTKAASTTPKQSKQSKVSPKPMSELSVHEHDRIRQKWHNLIRNDALVSNSPSSLEDARFQILVAARLHARCHESAVRKCMVALHEAGVLTCTALAACDPTVLASLLVNVPHYNNKAQQLVQAAQFLISRFHGHVPESKEDLLTIPGIGPVFADLLSVINTRTAHSKTNDDAVHV